MIILRVHLPNFRARKMSWLIRIIQKFLLQAAASKQKGDVFWARLLPPISFFDRQKTEATPTTTFCTVQ